MKTRFWLALPLLLLGACKSPIVGAECRPGFVDCDGLCVDVEQDHRHCGACGQACGIFTCSDGECTDELRRDAAVSEVDAGPEPQDGAADASEGGRPPPGNTPGGVGAPFLDGAISLPDGGLPSGCGIGQTACNAACAVLQTDPDHCGACGVACAPDEFCVAGECRDICDPPLTLCGTLCVLLDDDWRHCGACNNVCASGICRDG
jgi:hypothetical protein